MKTSEVQRWHIETREKSSRKEALYIKNMIRFFERKLKEKYSSLLDVSCGNGRLHTFLRKSGFEVIGIDKSNELIISARRKFPEFKECYRIADMRNFDLKRKFDVALSWFTSFGYYDDATNLKILRRIGENLRRNGLFLLDIPNPEFRIRRGARMWDYDYGKVLEIAYSKMQKINGRTYWMMKEKFYQKIDKDLKFLEEINRKIRLYNEKEIYNFVRKAGFRVLEIFTSQTFDKMNENTNQMLVVCKKI